jgi:2-C-methyl-D-erythritol 4-phosphate cytidylyltransferase
MSKLGIVIVAAGKGSRMKTAVSKQYLLLQNKPILLHTLEVFQSIEKVNEMVLVVGLEEVSTVQNWIEKYALTKVKCVVPGGSERQSSVYEGLLHLSTDIEWVMVHDGVRPFVTKEEIVHLLEKTRMKGAAVLAVPVKDTIKSVGIDGIIESTPDRSKLWSIQTPQAFRRSILIEAHKAAADEGFLGTDDSMLVERRGILVHVVEGDYNNIKITTPDDLARAESILEERNK